MRNCVIMEDWEHTIITVFMISQSNWAILFLECVVS